MSLLHACLCRGCAREVCARVGVACPPAARFVRGAPVPRAPPRGRGRRGGAHGGPAGQPAAHVGPAPPPAAHPRPPPPGGSRDKWRRGRRALSPERRRAALGPDRRRGLGARGPVTACVPAPSRPCPPGAAAPRPAVPASPRSAWAPAPLCACARARACLRVPGACAPLPGGGPEPTCRRRQLRVRVSVPRGQPCRRGCAPGAGGRGQAAKFFGGAWLTFLGDPRSCVSGGGDLGARSWCPGSRGSGSRPPGNPSPSRRGLFRKSDGGLALGGSARRRRGGGGGSSGLRAPKARRDLGQGAGWEAGGAWGAPPA